MAVLAQASPDELEGRWRAVATAPPPPHRMLRPPETGLVMVRGRAGGTGARFNVGEMTVTRCAVELEGGAVGVAYVRGRDRRHAELAAVLDALLQDPARRDDLEHAVVVPLAAAQTARRRAAAERVAPSRVEFFTLVRGDD
jgi:alpha-D-ribose 1-methylphosphonate 5-triphosphate synthase subunit PhnG